MGRVIELLIKHQEDINVEPFKFWSVNSLLHREDGFAVYFKIETGAYYLNGKLIADERFKHILKKVKNKSKSNARCWRSYAQENQVSKQGEEK